MITIANQFGMKEALAQLGIKNINEGTSTGLNHFSNGEPRKLFSCRWSIDSKVKTTTAADYEK
jgi:aldehyde dehydrogenase (NAD+)